MNNSTRRESTAHVSVEALRTLAQQHAVTSSQLIDALRGVAKWRLGATAPWRRSEPLSFMRSTERISTLLAPAEVMTESLLTRLEVKEV